MNKKIMLIVIIILVLGGLGAGAWYYFNMNKSSTNGRPMVKTDINPMDYMVFEVKKEGYSEFQTEKAFSMFTGGKNTINENLEQGAPIEDNASYYAWLNITSAQKMIGDYERAEKIWLWFTEVHAGNSISPLNLADLYKSFLVDQEKSEKYYKIALDREKNKFQIYYGLYELYRYRFEDEDKAVDILREGWENNPDVKDYVRELVDYLVLVDRKDEAEEVIDEWLINHPEDFSMKARLN